MDTLRQSTHPACVLAIDAGGTCFKSALVASGGSLLGESQITIPVDSQGSSEGILSVYGEIVSRAGEFADQSGYALRGIGIATPGPFNVHTGQYQMRHKFQDLYGMDLAAAIREISKLPEALPIRFIHDSHAFLMGECWRGHGRPYNRVAGVTLGTGLGFGCVIDGVILANKIGGPHFSLFQKPLGGRTLEERISRRGILTAYRIRQTAGGPADPDVREIAERARSGRDPEARAVFIESGKILLDYLEPVCNELGIECLLFGGQISRSYDLLQPAMKDIRTRIPTLQWVGQAAQIEESPLLGAGNLVFSGLPGLRDHVPELKITELNP